LLTRVILDPRLQTPPAARLLQEGSPGPVLLFCGPDASQKRRAKLDKAGVEIIEVPCRGDNVDLNAVLKELGKRDVLSLLVEGGSRVHWSFLSSKLVDKFYFIIAPLVLGGKQSVPSVGGKGYQSAADSPKFKLRSCFNAGPDVVLETYPSYSKSIISPWLSPESAPSGVRGLSPSSRRK
jgi:diaminohydroxyphosphoribosylaminopyrimidine deaminase/5-amino-6-(5-phosphoribosylamino)uracil reductase